MVAPIFRRTLTVLTAFIAFIAPAPGAFASAPPIRRPRQSTGQTTARNRAAHSPQLPCPSSFFAPFHGSSAVQLTTIHYLLTTAVPLPFPVLRAFSRIIRRSTNHYPLSTNHCSSPAPSSIHHRALIILLHHIAPIHNRIHRTHPLPEFPHEIPKTASPPRAHPPLRPVHRRLAQSPPPDSPPTRPRPAPPSPRRRPLHGPAPHPP